MDICITSLRELETQFLRRYERRILDSMGSSLGEFFACLAQVLNGMRNLMRAAHRLAEVKEHNSIIRLWDYANQIAETISEAISNIPVYPGKDFVVILKALKMQILSLRGNAPSSSGHKAPPATMVLLQKVQAEFENTEAALLVLEECTLRWMPVLDYLAGLKEELREPIIAFLRDVEMHFPGGSSSMKPLCESWLARGSTQSSEQKISVVAAEKRRDKEFEYLQRVVNENPAVRRALILESETDILLDQMNNLLTNVADFAVNMNPIGSDVILNLVSGDEEESKKLRKALQLLSDEHPARAANDCDTGHKSSAGTSSVLRRGTVAFLEDCAETIYRTSRNGEQLQNVGITAEGQTFGLQITILRQLGSLIKECGEGKIQEFKFDFDLFEAMFKDWIERLKERRSVEGSGGLDEYYAASKKYDEAQVAISMAISNDDVRDRVRTRLLEAYKDVVKRVETVCWREFQERVLITGGDALLA